MVKRKVSDMIFDANNKLETLMVLLDTASEREKDLDCSHLLGLSLILGDILDGLHRAVQGVE